MKSKEQWWYVSFGVGHLLRNYYIKIYDDYESVRKRILRQFGRCWCAIYTEAEWQQCLDRGHFKDLTEINIPSKDGEDLC